MEGDAALAETFQASPSKGTAFKLSTTGYTVSLKLRKPPGEALSPILALASALAIRSIPDLLFPYLIEFDTPPYFVFGKNYASNGQLNFVLGQLYAAGIGWFPRWKSSQL